MIELNTMNSNIFDTLIQKGVAKDKAIDLVNGKLVLKNRNEVNYKDVKTLDLIQEKLIDSYGQINTEGKQNIDENLVILTRHISSCYNRLKN